MKCKRCGAELIEGAKYCYSCGDPIKNEVEQEELISETPKEKAVVKLPSITLIGLVLSAIAFVASLVLMSMTLARNAIVVGHDTLMFIPAFTGLAIGLYTLKQALAQKDKMKKIFSIVILSLAGFAIFYGFLTYCILLG